MFNLFNFEDIPKLPGRENNVDKFSNYITFDNQNDRMVIQWKYKPHLKRNLELYAERSEKLTRLCQRQDKGRALVNFWLDMALNEPQLMEDWEPENRRQLALEHLATYCEENCYWSAKQVWKECPDRSWEEFFCIARLIVHEANIFLPILKNYERTIANIDTYIQQILINKIKTEASVGKFSDWRLLYKKSDKELREALQILGRREPEISCFMFARKYFKQVYLVNRVKAPTRKSGKKWPEPETEDFDTAAQCYNVEKSLPSTPHEVSAASATITGEQMKAWMEICIKALHNYPRSIAPHFSLESLKTFGYEVQSDYEVQPEEANDSLDMQLQADSAAGESEQGKLSFVNKIDTVFQDKLKSLNNIVEKKVGDEIMLIDRNKILPLYYGFGLTQKQLEARIGVKQYTLSRHLTKYERQLLDTLAGLSQPNQWVKQYVEGWLVQNYQIPNRADLIQAALIEAIKKINSQEREVLQLRYGQKMNEKEISVALNISQDKVTERVRQAKAQLQQNLISEIEKWLNEYVQKWLKKYYKSCIYSIVRKALLELDPKWRQVLQHRYSQKLSKQLTKKLNYDDKVAEINSRARNQLRDELLNWLQENLAVSLETEAEKEKINTVLEEGLKIAQLNQGA